ncbi:MAG TPA: hypothetical protein PKE12_13075 [Kiritimatiellia bacterium]|nr:hypothetical protein [Kiritimatiellia bacterium]
MSRTVGSYSVVIVLLGIVLGITARNLPGRERGRARAHLMAINEAAGFVLGRAVAEALPGGGEVVLLYTPHNTEDGQAVQDAQVTGLKAALDPGRFRCTLARSRSGPSVGDAQTDEEWLAADIEARRVATSHAQTAALVILTGQPEREVVRLQRDRPLVYVLNAVDNPSLRALLAEGRVRGAVVYAPDFDPTAQPESGMAVDEVFALRFRYLAGP